ncbi:hypothetical protein B9479_000254 [Cryptococcus floricola]|uniref:Endoplasmic reticulum-based factor for assembly of V-ATPase n=1 Tax=Cryptococcus floricola TaxID=2591691 RepID=A0A5D3B7B3_9TREE|nr:hypothetical protein B9479_000254 [Cryptococcus floricola]
MSTILILPPQLLETINNLLKVKDLPEDLRKPLVEAASQTVTTEVLAVKDVPVVEEKIVDQDGDQSEDTSPSPPPPPPTIDLDLLERLSTWATSDEGGSKLLQNELDPLSYTHIALVSGTEVYLTPKQLKRLRAAEDPDKPNPYLPSYLSPAPPSFGTEYRTLTRTLSTVINILFSIFGAAVAVYVAATSGAGYSREKGVLLGVLAGVVVGIADGVLVIIFQGRVQENRKERWERGRKLMTGSGKMEPEAPEAETKEAVGMEDKSEAGPSALPKRIQLKRRAIKESSTD